MIACYLGLYEEGEVKHINGPTHPCPTKWFANSKVKGVKMWWLFIEFFCVYVLQHVLSICIKILLLTAGDNKNLGQTPLICETEPSEILSCNHFMI